MRVRGGSGLGDALYMLPIVENLLQRGEEVVICSDYPEVFSGTRAKAAPFSRERIDVLAHYVQGKSNPATNQWEDVCNSARVKTPLRFSWEVRNGTLIADLRERAEGRKLIMVHGGRTPMNRQDGFGKELLPERVGFERVLGELRDCFTVRVGTANDQYALDVSYDLNSKTSITDLIDLGASCDGIVGQCSFVVPLAEGFDKSLLVVWAARGLRASHPYIAMITPKKILSKPSSRYVMDDWDDVREVVNAFRNG